MELQTCAIVAASLLRVLDPYTTVYQTDDDAKGAAISSEKGYWPMMQGLKDPLAEKPSPCIVHTVFRHSETPSATCNADEPSPLFKVNQVGYIPISPKFAYAGAWLGPEFGPWKPRAAMDSFELVRIGADGAEEPVLKGKPVLRIPDRTTKDGVPATGEETYEMDFSSVTGEGTYFVRIPGVGRSETFRISDSAAEDAFRVHMQGLYQKRCGMAKTMPYTRWTAGRCHARVVRGTFPPDEGTLRPKVKWFDIIRANTDWKNGEKVDVPGGWHDAADYDRRPQHLNIVNDLCAVYLMKPENFRDGQLAIPENANGIPDILDEADWGLRHILAGQREDGGAGTWIEGTRHPSPGNVAERDAIEYALSRPTRRSSLMYAAHASLLARCHPAMRERYAASAVRAWNFAVGTRPCTDTFEIRRKQLRFFEESVAVDWKEDEKLPPQYLVKAAVNLSALTGDGRYLDHAAKHMAELVSDVKSRAWNWPPLVFSGELALGTPRELDGFFAAWKARIKKQADGICSEMETSCAYRSPWPGPADRKSDTMGWGACHPLRRAQYLVAAHGMTGDRRYLDAASLANDFHNGCNPQGTTLTSGLGRVYPVKFLDLPSYVDGVAEFTPGITPYRWTTKIPPKALELAWRGDKARASRWPIWRRWWNLENQTVAASEFTVWETIAPAASVTGYLAKPSNSVPPPPRAPADDVGKLPGYWLLP